MDFRKFLDSANVDSCIFSTSSNHTDENFYYFTGLSKTSQVTATAIINKTGVVILTNKLEHSLFRGKGRIIIIENRGGAERAIKEYTGKTVGVDFSSTSASQLINLRKLLRGRRIVNISKSTAQARSIKSHKEIRKIKEACRLAEDTLDGVEKLIKKCRTEKGLALELEYVARRSGAESVAFPPIVAFGKNSALPHHASEKTKLGRGLLLVDFGVVFGGYCSDITRTFYLGKADEKTNQIYEAVYSAQQAAIKQIKAGANAKDVHNAANRVLEENLGQKLIHSIGHGLGIDVHDYPESLNNKSKDALKNNMTITIEPGYYEKGWGGIRIEDDVLVKNRAILMTKSPSHIREI